MKFFSFVKITTFLLIFFEFIFELIPRFICKHNKYYFFLLGQGLLKIYDQLGSLYWWRY